MSLPNQTPDPILTQEREYADMVRRTLLGILTRAGDIASGHRESVRAIIADAWEDLRARPTELSPQDLEQLSVEADRFLARKKLLDDDVRRYGRMLAIPFFARVDFREEGMQPEKYVIGLHSLKNEAGDLIVFDWRAPISNLYYDALPGPASYDSPSGAIRGEMLLKRQYKIRNGQVEFYVDTNYSIDDGMLLDILSSSTGRHMRQIVSTIQAEQNAVIRHREDDVVTVVGCAGSGKTSVAMHRAAYLMYHSTEKLTAAKIEILSPGAAFSEYVSGVLPELGEENIKTATLPDLVSRILSRRTEDPAEQLRRLLGAAGGERVRSVSYKSGQEFLRKLEKFAADFEVNGPAFSDIPVSEGWIIRAEELTAMYRGEFSALTCAQRLERMRGTMDSRLSGVKAALSQELEEKYSRHFKGKELRRTVRIALMQRMEPLNAKIGECLGFSGQKLLRRVLADAPEEIRDAFRDDAEAGFLAWEDAVAEAYLAVRLGFVQPDKSVCHLLIDEAQDYTDTALRLLKLYFPAAAVTILGDPMQRTQPGLTECRPEDWSGYFGGDGTLFRLNRCYRSTRQIAEVCGRILPEADLVGVGREGAEPVIGQYSPERVKEQLLRDRADGFTSIAVVTRTPRMAEELSRILPDVYRLDGGDADSEYRQGDTVVGQYHMMKGLEFDDVIVAWDGDGWDAGERRRLYTAATRALHRLSVFCDARMREELTRESV